MDSHRQYNARAVDEVFHDFKGRRAGLIKALTTDVEKIRIQFDPEKKNMWLYGYPTEEWEVSLPTGDSPPVLPEPVLGLNFARNGMQEKHWLSLVATHCDQWLFGVVFFKGTKYGINKSDRDHLFKMINELPTIFEVVTGAAKKQLRTFVRLQNPRLSRQRHWNLKMRLRNWRGKTTNMSYVVLVGCIMALAISGFAVTYVINGSIPWEMRGNHPYYG